MGGHPVAPAQLEQLRQVEAVDRDDDEREGEVGEAAQLAPEDRLVLVLQRVVEAAVPLVEQHQHVDRGQIERDDGREQGARLPFFFGTEIGQGQAAHLASELADAFEFGEGFCHGKSLNGWSEVS